MTLNTQDNILSNLNDIHIFKNISPFYKLRYIYPQERVVYVVCMRVSSMLEAAAASLWSGRVEAAQCPASASDSQRAPILLWPHNTSSNTHPCISIKEYRALVRNSLKIGFPTTGALVWLFSLNYKVLFLHLKLRLLRS